MVLAHFAVWTLSVVTVVLGADMVSGQAYPSKPIRIVTAEPASGSEFVARIVAQGLTGSLGQPVIVDSQGGGGSIYGDVVARAAPDGYTLMVTGSSVWIGTLLRKAPYDPIKDFATISLMVTSPNILVVNPSLPVASVKQLIALAKAKPGDLNYAASGVGSSLHLAAELFKTMAGVNIVCIPYKSTRASLNDLIGGQVHLMFSTAPPVKPHMQSGRLRALAITSASPSELFPGLATVAASGVPGFEMVAITAIFAPAKTPGSVINRLNQEVVSFINKTDVKETLFNGGSEVVGSSPQQLAATVKSDMAKMGKVIKDADIRSD